MKGSRISDSTPAPPRKQRQHGAFSVPERLVYDLEERLVYGLEERLVYAARKDLYMQRGT
eukprot:2625928-Rhodomonas_salina.1